MVDIAEGITHLQILHFPCLIRKIRCLSWFWILLNLRIIWNVHMLFVKVHKCFYLPHHIFKTSTAYNLIPWLNYWIQEQICFLTIFRNFAPVKRTSSAVTSASGSVTLPDWVAVKVVTSADLLIKEFSKAANRSMRFSTNEFVLIWGSMMNCVPLDITWASSSVTSQFNRWFQTWGWHHRRSVYIHCVVDVLTVLAVKRWYQNNPLRSQIMTLLEHDEDL